MQLNVSSTKIRKLKPNVKIIPSSPLLLCRASSHSHGLSSHRHSSSAQAQRSDRAECREGALLHRSESQQWMRTPGSSCCWQCLDVAQPLVKTMPKAAARRGEETDRQTDKQSVNQSNRQLVKGRVTSCCVAQQAQENARVSSRECKCVIRETFSDLRDTLIRTCVYSRAPLTTLQPSN